MQSPTRAERDRILILDYGSQFTQLIARRIREMKVYSVIVPCNIEHEKLANWSLAVTEKDGAIVFLKKITAGPADSSYGLHVAQLAGIPEEVIMTARRLQRNAGAFSRDYVSPDNENAAARAQSIGPPAAELFPRSELILEAIRGLNIDKLRPLDALALLARFRDELRSEDGAPGR